LLLSACRWRWALNDRLARGSSWGLVSFCHREDAETLLLGGFALPAAAAGWHIRAVKPDQMRSLQAAFMATAAHVGHSSRGRALWLFMQSRLRSLINMQRVWGDVHSMYESRDVSIFQNMPLPRCIRDPDSAWTALWHAVQVVLLLYISVVLPLRLAFAVEVGPRDPGFWADLVADCFFAVDLVLNFRTAYHDAVTGVREERPRKIAANYLAGWFAFDLLSCLPFQYFQLEGGGAGKGVKALRLLRMAKMLRIAKLKKLMAQHLKGQYGLVSQVTSTVAIFLSIIYVAHLLACCWCAQPRATQSFRRRLVCFIRDSPYETHAERRLGDSTARG
jgi:hypothetical protein